MRSSVQGETPLGSPWPAGKPHTLASVGFSFWPHGRAICGTFRTSSGQPRPRGPLPRRGFFPVDNPKIVNPAAAFRPRTAFFVDRFGQLWYDLLDIRQKSWAMQPSFSPNIRQPNRAQLPGNPRPNATKPLSFCCVRTKSNNPQAAVSEPSSPFS